MHGIPELNPWDRSFLEDLGAVQAGYVTALRPGLRVEIERNHARPSLVTDQLVQIEKEKLNGFSSTVT